jgi:hypothetical protein
MMFTFIFPEDLFGLQSLFQYASHLASFATSS